MFSFYNAFKNGGIFLGIVFRKFNKNLEKHIINILHITFFFKLISLTCHRLYKYNRLIENRLLFLFNITN